MAPSQARSGLTAGERHPHSLDATRVLRTIPALVYGTHEGRHLRRLITDFPSALQCNFLLVSHCIPLALWRFLFLSLLSRSPPLHASASDIVLPLTQVTPKSSAVLGRQLF